MPTSRLTIRIGAAHDEVIIDGHTFDRSPLNRHQRHAMAAFITEALFPPRPEKKRRFKARKKKRK